MVPGSPAWVLPRANASTLCCFAAGGYRDGGRRLVDVRPVPMPFQAVHALDPIAGVLVYADGGELVVVRGIAGGALSTSRIPLPAELSVRALVMRDGVVYVGGRCPESPGSMLGLLDLAAGSGLSPLRMELDRRERYQGIERLVLSNDRLIVVGDVPKHVYDVADARAPRLAEAHRSRLVRVRHRWIFANERVVVMLLPPIESTGAMVSVLDLASQQNAGIIVERAAPGVLQGRLGDLRAVAAVDDIVLLAAGSAGVGVVRVEPPRAPRKARPGDRVVRLSADEMPTFHDDRLVAAHLKPVLDVVPVDRTHAIAVGRRGGQLDSELVRID
jgi:hypothetical protein